MFSCQIFSSCLISGIAFYLCCAAGARSFLPSFSRIFHLTINHCPLPLLLLEETTTFDFFPSLRLRLQPLFWCVSEIIEWFIEARFFAVGKFGSSPSPSPPFPLSSASCLSFSVFLCVARAHIFRRFCGVHRPYNLGYPRVAHFYIFRRFCQYPGRRAFGGREGRRGGGGAKSYDGEKTWSSINHSIRSGVNGRIKRVTRCF